MEPSASSSSDERICIKDKKGCYALEPFKSLKDSVFHLDVCSSIFPGKKYIAIVSNNKLSIYKCPSMTLLKLFDDLDLVSSVDFSPREEYVIIIQKPSIENNLKVISLQDCAIKYKFHSTTHPSHQWPQITFSTDETIIFRQTKQLLEIYKLIDGKEEKAVSFDKIIAYEKAQFTNANGDIETALLAGKSIPNPKGGRKCFFSMYSFNNFTKPMKEMNIALTDRMKLKLSSDQKCILIQSFNDNTSSESYYGVSTLYYTDLITLKFTKFTLPEGPIHDFDWYPNGKHFLVCAGHLPSKTYVYKSDSMFIKELCIGKHNTIRISPDSRIIALAGFGSLGGDIEFYNLENYQLIGKMNFFCCVSFNWSSNSQYILGAVLSTRVKVDNEYRILKYNGEEVLCDKNVGEIYDCFWINDSNTPYTPFPIVVNEKSLENKKKPGVVLTSTLGQISFSNKNMGNTDNKNQKKK